MDGNSLKRSRSSGILKSGESYEAEENKDQDRSVTVLSHQHLPSYSCERYYMLSEIQENANAVVFFNDLDPDDTDTQETADLSIDEAVLETPSPTNLPRYLFLYLLWKPHDNNDPETYTQTIIKDAVARISHISTTKPDPNQTDHRIYLVVDRLTTQPAESGEGEALARCIASVPELRNQCAGCTVGVSNHERAAPGLQLVMDALQVGASDRRKMKGRLTPSDIGVVSDTSQTLLGLQEENVTDAAEGVSQYRVCAEWNGQGNIQTFATKVHGHWREAHGLPRHPPAPPPLPKKKRVRRGRKMTEAERDAALKAFLLDMIGTLLIIVFILYHYPSLLGKYTALSWSDDSGVLENVAHVLRQ